MTKRKTMPVVHYPAAARKQLPRPGVPEYDDARTEKVAAVMGHFGIDGGPNILVQLAIRLMEAHVPGYAQPPKKGRPATTKKREAIAGRATLLSAVRENMEANKTTRAEVLRSFSMKWKNGRGAPHPWLAGRAFDTLRGDYANAQSEYEERRRLLLAALLEKWSPPRQPGMGLFAGADG